MGFTNSTKLKLITMSILAVIVLIILTVVSLNSTPKTALNATRQTTLHPLDNKTIYKDDMRSITKIEKQFRTAGRTVDADALKVVSSQPGTTWLVGPNASNPTAQKDIDAVIQTSSEAATQKTTPVYQLYAIPNRDACADYSKGGFASSSEYTNWIDQIIAATKTPSVFLVETDSIGNIAAKDCLSLSEVSEREQLLKTTVEKLRQSPNALAIYLDAAHSEWFPDTSKLVGPLTRSGYDSSDGIFVNTSFFVETDEITQWSKKLLDELGGNKGVIIDTSRNGSGAPAQDLTGEDRWCNPEGRSIGVAPNTKTGVNYVHAYLWIKNIGESDGSCADYPTAGTFVPQLALDLVRNRK